MTRAELLEQALAGGAGLAEAVEAAARAELWLSGELSSGELLGRALALPKPNAAPAAAPAKATRPGHTAPETHSTARRRDGSVLTAIRSLGPAATTKDLAAAAGVSTGSMGMILDRLEDAKRIRRTRVDGQRRIQILPAAAPCAKTGTMFPAPRGGGGAARDVTAEILDPGPGRRSAEAAT